MAVSDFNCPGCSLPGLKANEINYGRVQADVRKSWAFRNVIDQAIFTHRVFVNLYIAGSSAAPNSGPSTKMVSSCVMTSWKKKHLKSSLCIPSQTQTHTRSAAGRRYYPLLHITNCIFTLSLPSSTCAKCSETTLRPTGQSSGNCFPYKNTELPELSYLSVLWSGRVHIIAHLWGFILSRRPRFLWIFVLVMIRLQPFPHQCSLGAALKPLPTPGQLMTDLGSKGMQ